MIEFRKTLLKEDTPKTVKDLAKTNTFQKGIKRRGKNIEGSELFDCDGEEIDANEFDKEELDDDETSNKIEVKGNAATDKTNIVQLYGQCENDDVNKDALWLDKFQDFLMSDVTQNTSKNLYHSCLILRQSIRKLDEL